MQLHPSAVNAALVLAFAVSPPAADVYSGRPDLSSAVPGKTTKKTISTSRHFAPERLVIRVEGRYAAVGDHRVCSLDCLKARVALAAHARGFDRLQRRKHG
jgi:hypothetical protein